MIYIGIVVSIFLVDFMIKNHMEKTLITGEQRPYFGGRLILHKHHNKGAFMNLGEKKTGTVAVVSLLLTVAITMVFLVTICAKDNTRLKVGLSMLLGGAFSNTYDRLKRKYVMDYMSFGVKWKWLSRMIFNLSDFFILIGALMASFGGCKK